MPLLRRLLFWLVALASAPAWSQGLPPEIEAALARARLPREAVTLMVVQADGQAPARLAHRIQVPVNPASVAKLATTFAALELMGPAFTWATPVYIDGPVQAGVLQGNLYIRGQGDPKLVLERLWLLLRRVQALGIRQISGDILLDRNAFESVMQDPGAFDGEPLRPYNAAPDALLLNFKSLVLTFSPGQGQALVQVEPPLAGVTWPTALPLAPGGCGDWRAGLKAELTDPAQLRFAGSYPSACGERSWPMAYSDPNSYAPRAVAGLWQELDGKLDGRVRYGTVPPLLKPLFELQSPSLMEAVRDINKFSNNVMAQQLFLTLSLQQKGVGTLEGSREVLQSWWRQRIGPDAPLLDSGSGLSRETRISAQQLARLLQRAWASPLMPELMSSLPVAGTDGTLRRSRAASLGQAHLKTGSLRDVAAVAGYVHAASGKRYVLVAIANHPDAGAMRPVFDALIDWTARDQ